MHILFAVKLDECLLLVGQQDVLAIVPALVVVYVALVIKPFSFGACALEDEFAVDVVLSGSVVMTASQIDWTGEQLVGREGAAHVDVGHDAAGCPLVGRIAVECSVAAVGSGMLLPDDGQEVTFVVEAVVVDIDKFSVLVDLRLCHVKTRLVPLSALGVLGRLAANLIVVRVLLVPFSILRSGVIDPGPCFPLDVAVVIGRRQQNDVCTDSYQAVACACHQREKRKCT